MLGWIAAFLILAILAGVLGFSGVAVAAAGIAQITFYLFVGLLIITLITFAVRR